MDIASKKLDDFFKKSKILRYRRGETILRAGDNPSGVYFLKKGFVRLFAISKGGDEQTLIIFKEGDFFPLIWAITSEYHNEYFVEAMTPCELLRSPRDQFLKFVGENPDVLFDLTGKILTRLGGLLKRMEYMAFGTAYAKIASILLICAQRFGKREAGGVWILVPLTHSSIASLVGVTRETASLEVKRLEKSGLVVKKNGLFFIKSIEKLKRESLLE
ncbi:MAG TPA: Crp/Fnr family transcriptional regulator [Candidatus Saccharimonadales bacterium]|nr:Crp/Fnr family transcriptional regulator [Candidatus Saccharimonadales bacterium]